MGGGGGSGSRGPGLQLSRVDLKTCQNSVVGAAEYGQSAGVQSVGVSDVWMQGSKTWLKLVCFALATGTGMSLYFGESE